MAAAAVDVDCPLVEPMASTVIVASSFDQSREAIFEHLLWFLRPSLDRYRDRPRGPVLGPGLGESGVDDESGDRRVGAGDRLRSPA